MPATNELLQEGRYRINHQFTHEGSGAVYEAYDTVRETDVVVKEIVVRLNKVTTISQQENLKLAFANQAKILTQIDHDSLLHVHDFFSEIGRQYLVMESVGGDDLATLLERNSRAFAVSDVTNWADQILDALNYLHNYNPPIVHKNIKPKNIKLSPDGKVKLLAFGLADGSETKITTNLVDDSKESTIINYSPLEQLWDGLDAASQKVITNSYDDRSERLLKEPMDARSDVYSLGATLYHLLTARQPIDPLERSIDILEGKTDPLRSPHNIDPSIPIEIADVVMRAMEIKRENRFDSAVIMRQVLRTATIRIQERESDEAREQEEAAEDLRFAEKTRHDQVQKHVEQKRLEMEAEQKRQAEVLEQKLREVEEQRLLAEQRAAEAERLLQEKETEKAAEAKAATERAATEKAAEEIAFAEKAAAEKAVAEKTAAAESAAEAVEQGAAERLAAKIKAKAALRAASDLDDDLLELNKPTQAGFDAAPQIHSSMPETIEQVSAFKQETVEPEVRAFFDETEAVSATANAKSEEHVESVELDRSSNEATEKVVNEPEPKTLHAEAEKDSFSNPVMDYSSDTEAAVKSGLSIPMVAGGAVLLIFLGIGAWFFLGSGTSAPASTVSQPAAAPVNDAAVLPSPESTEPEQVVVERSTDTTVPASRTAAQPTPVRPKKTEPTKAPAAKKPVTVDDLINDN